MLTAFRAAAASAAPASLCVGVMPLKPSTSRGQAARWEVGAWTEGGNVPHARIRLQATAGAGSPAFTFGCAAGNGTSACDLGAVDAGSAQRLLQAQVTVPLTTALTAVRLTVTGTAAGLTAAPAASATVTVLVPGSPAAADQVTLPGITPPAPTLSPGGNAADLFPTLNPSPTAPDPGSTGPERASRAAHASTFSGASNQIDAEVAGLAALALAFILAFTRVSIRRPVPSAPGTSAPSEPATKALEQPGKPGETPEAPSV